MEEFVNDGTEKQDLIILTPSLKHEFVTTAKWGKYIAIICFVVAAMNVITGISMLWINHDDFSVYSDDDAMQGMKAGLQWSSAIVIWICALVCFFVSWLLLSGSKKMLDALTDNIQQDYLAGMQKIRLFTQIVGVISLITLCFSLITVLSMIMVNIIK